VILKLLLTFKFASIGLLFLVLPMIFQFTFRYPETDLIWTNFNFIGFLVGMMFGLVNVGIVLNKFVRRYNETF
jgi:hypothetical protein